MASYDGEKHNIGKQRGFTIVLDNSSNISKGTYHDTAIPIHQGASVVEREAVPEKLRQMRILYTYGRESQAGKARNFYRQGMFMQDYEDDYPWEGDFVCYFPTYQNLTTKQLRGFFSWRTRVRNGDYQQIASSAAYIYLYELLNGIGTGSPEDSLQKMKAFEEGYINSGLGDQRMQQNLRRWMFEFAAVHDMPAETVMQYADPEILENDSALAVLGNPYAYSDEEVFSALAYFEGSRLKQSPVVAREPERGRHLFVEVWRRCASEYSRGGRSLFTLCFGERRNRAWHPLSNAIYYMKETPRDKDIILNECRSYHLKDGLWTTETYQKLFYDRDMLQGFIHETDYLLRRYLKTGRYLKENPKDIWALPYIETVIREDQQAIIEALRPKITIDMSGLEKIRQEAIVTRDSLLTEEELDETAEEIILEERELSDEAPTDLPLDKLQIRILKNLLTGQPVDQLIRDNCLMPSLVADIINEALFDEIGDVVITCEDDELGIVEDYGEDLRRLIGGI